MYCENCGARIDDDSMFCENCGVLIKKEKPIVSETGDVVDKETKKIQPITSLDQLMEDGGFKESFDVASTGELDPFTEEEQPEFDVGEDRGEAGLETHADKGEGLELEEEPLLDEKETMEEESFVPPESEPDQPDLKKDTEKNDEKSDDVNTVVAEEQEEPVPATFCMACGRRLPKGAAFCDACGTPTGEVAPAAIHMRSAKQGMFVRLVKGFFVKPAETIKKAAGEDAFLSGVGFFLIKDLIIAILGAVFMSRLMAVLGGLGALVTGGDVVGFGARVFLIAVLMDALWVGLLYGVGLLFRGKGSFKALVGACGTASIFPGILLILTIVLMGFFPAATICALVVTAAAQIMVMSKAVESAMEIDGNLRIYMIPAAVLCFAVVMDVIAKIFS